MSWLNADSKYQMFFRKFIVADAIWFVYLGLWFLFQYIGKNWTNSTGVFVEFLLFLSVQIGIVGILGGMFLKYRSKLPWIGESSSKDKIVGGIFYIIVLLIGLVVSDSIFSINYALLDFFIILRYISLFIPMSFSLSLLILYILPQYIYELFKNLTNDKLFAKKFINAAFVGCIVYIGVFFGFWVDVLFDDIMFAIIMGGLGILTAVGMTYWRNFPLMWGIWFIIMFFNTLSDAQYHTAPILPIIIGFGFCVVIFIVALVLFKNNKDSSVASEQNTSA